MRINYLSKLQGLKNPIKSYKNFCSIEKLFNSEKIQQYKQNGYAVIPNVFGKNLLDELQKEIDNIIINANKEEIRSIFDANHLETDKYFLDSGDKVNLY